MQQAGCLPSFSWLPPKLAASLDSKLDSTQSAGVQILGLEAKNSFEGGVRSCIMGLISCLFVEGRIAVYRGDSAGDCTAALKQLYRLSNAFLSARLLPRVIKAFGEQATYPMDDETAIEILEIVGETFICPRVRFFGLYNRLHNRLAPTRSSAHGSVSLGAKQHLPATYSSTVVYLDH